MPSSFQAITVIVVGLLPGALYMWAFERQAGRYGIGLSDRVLRFIGGSALFFAVFAGPLYAVYSNYGAPFSSGMPLPRWLLLLPPVFVGLPILVGTLVGLGLRKGKNWAQKLTGPDPAPRAWDHLFQYKVDGWVRLRLKSGTWLAGAFAEANGQQSYAAGYPEPQDLFLAASVDVDPATGDWRLDGDGNVTLGQGGILVRWEEIEYLEFTDAKVRDQK